jgi:ribosomal protein S18 acetylase RimI-like enzyme
VRVSILRRGEAAVLDRVAPGVFDEPIDRRRSAVFLADPRHHIAVAVEDGIVVGFATAVRYVNPDKPPELWINEIGVARRHRRRGYGRELLRTLFDQGRRRGCVEAWVLTEPTNRAALGLYRKAGGKRKRTFSVMFEFSLEKTRKTKRRTR